MKRNIGKNGQSMVELCLILPILLIVLLGGIIDFGYAFYNYIALQQLANDTAMFASSPYVPITEQNASGTSEIGQTDEDIKNFVKARKPPLWNYVDNSSPVHNDLFVTLPAPFKTADGLAYVRRVTLDFRSPLLTPFWKAIADVSPWKEGIPLRTSSVFQVPRNIWRSL